MTPEESGKADPVESALVTVPLVIVLSCVSFGVYLLGHAAFHRELQLVL